MEVILTVPLVIFRISRKIPEKMVLWRLSGFAAP